MDQTIASTYELIQRLGSGGGGIVYLANHNRLNKKVVLKVDKRDPTVHTSLLRREVDVLKELNHPFIPKVHDFFAKNDMVYTVMDYISGESLDKPLKRGEVFSQPQVIKWAKQLLNVLDYLHSPIHGDPPRGFVHSDIKPANIMRTPENNICLIDFNIALALGETKIIGQSIGYSSPEHYGLDFSSNYDLDPGNDTILLGETKTAVMPHKKVIVPDARSDIYSLGATLYHLLSGMRPAKNATDVIPLPKDRFSPQLSDIIAKAMQPDPMMRYQSAKEMLAALDGLRDNDPRTVRLKRSRKIICSVCSVLLAAGAFAAFTGLKRMQTAESWLKYAEYSSNALEAGDVDGAIEQALKAFPGKTSIFTPQSPAKAQKALTDALGVYDLSDSFKPYKTLELSSEALDAALSPNGKTAVCICLGRAQIIDADTGEITVELETVNSALAGVEFIDNDRIIYAANDGVTVYDIKENKVVWKGGMGSEVSLSEDKKTAAVLNNSEECVYIYEVGTGRQMSKIDFTGKHRAVPVNEAFVDPQNSIFSLNEDGSRLALSFDDGSVNLYNLDESKDTLEYESGSAFYRFSGGFFGKYFAFAPCGDTQNAFAILDTKTKETIGAMMLEQKGRVYADRGGIYLCKGGSLTAIDPLTFEEALAVNMNEDIKRFVIGSERIAAATDSSIAFFDKALNKLGEIKLDRAPDIIELSKDTAILANADSSTVRIVRTQENTGEDILSYPPNYPHSEARLSADENTVMLFSYDHFGIFDVLNGSLINETLIPNAEGVYDQQFVRGEDGSFLETYYYDGSVRVYSAADGELVEERSEAAPDTALTEVFYTDDYKIEAPLHGAPKVYDKNSGKLIKELKEDAYITYVTQAGKYIAVQYIRADDGGYYGLLLDDKCETIAYLPYLSDVIGERLIFDLPTGDLRESRIYDINELIKMARKN